MADNLMPSPTGRLFAVAIMLAGGLLVFCAVLPWAGLQATSELVGAGVTRDVRGIDDTFGVWTLIAGLVAIAFGLAGLLTRPRVAALAALPGALATLVLVLFVTDSAGFQDRVSIDLGRFLSIEPVIRYGWFAALASSLAVVLLALLALARRRAR
ncbi:hypothetical protein [Nonomuraea sp. SBT364]|uniref:hypothetical protein n=1 Tax=Nonomuraea sp. SBT364 TaxID=1580530 RepID=UPI00066A3ADF|nr:hypothetical protein [Nonomuraea sp. SBT364]